MTTAPLCRNSWCRVSMIWRDEKWTCPRCSLDDARITPAIRAIRARKREAQR